MRPGLGAVGSRGFFTVHPAELGTLLRILLVLPRRDYLYQLRNDCHGRSQVLVPLR